MRTLLIDNYDSYTYNLYQIIAEVNGEPPLVYYNDEITLEQIASMVHAGAVHSIVISPGPGTPSNPHDIGVCLDVLQHLPTVPVLGICLGHQALAHVHGAKVVCAPEPVHGRLSRLVHTSHPLFADVPSGDGFEVVRYHSLLVDAATLPDCLEAVCWTQGGHSAVSLQRDGGRRGAEAGAHAGLVATAEPGPGSSASSRHASRAASNGGAAAGASGCGGAAAAGRSEHQPSCSGRPAAEEAGVAGGRCASPGCTPAGPRDSGQGHETHRPPGVGQSVAHGLGHGALLMGLAHRTRPHYGVQFHPESVATSYGIALLRNFADMAADAWRRGGVVEGVAAALGGGLAEAAVAGGGGATGKAAVERLGGALDMPRPVPDIVGPPGRLPASLPPWPHPDHQRDAPLRLAWRRLGGAAAAREDAAQGPQGEGLSGAALLEAVGGSQGLFEELYGWGPDTFWLDSATTDRGRFSYMGGPGGALWRKLTYRLPPPGSAAGPPQGPGQGQGVDDAPASDGGSGSASSSAASSACGDGPGASGAHTPSCCSASTSAPCGGSSGGAGSAHGAHGGADAAAGGHAGAPACRVRGTLVIERLCPPPCHGAGSSAARGAVPAPVSGLSSSAASNGAAAVHGRDNGCAHGTAGAAGGASPSANGVHPPVLPLLPPPPPGRSREVLTTGLLDHLQVLMAQQRLHVDPEAAAQLPFNFWGGLVGYLGYELKAESGAALAHASPNPDAVLYVADRLLAVDHHTQEVYLLALYEQHATARGGAAGGQEAAADAVGAVGTAEAEARGWLQETEERILRLAAGARGRKAAAAGSCAGGDGGRHSAKAGLNGGSSSAHNGTSAAGCCQGAAVAGVSGSGEGRGARAAAAEHQLVDAAAQGAPHSRSAAATLLAPTAVVSVAHAPAPSHAPPAPTPFVLAHGRDAYLSNIAACHTALRAGESYEVCLTTALLRDAAPHPADLYRTLRRLNPAPYAAWLHCGPQGPTICCSSPERFLRGDRGGLLEARPIKGTAARVLADPAADAAAADALSCSEKERAENLMIVDLLRNDLGRVCEVGSVCVPGLMEIESYATVHQMVSTVVGLRRQGLSAVDCVRAAFPGGSMTGAPKVRTMAIIDALEGRARGVYSGCIGFLSFNDTFDLNIVIRTAVVAPQQEQEARGQGHEYGLQQQQQQQAGRQVPCAQACAGEDCAAQHSRGAAGTHARGPAGQCSSVHERGRQGMPALSIGAGGAIVVQSDPVAEYDEMRLKASALLRAVGLCEGGSGPVPVRDGAGP